MGFNENLILIDSDFRRRAAISHAMAPAHIHTEPFETVSELAQSWPRSGIILIHDTGDALAELVRQMSVCAEWFPVIAFSENPGASQVASAIHEGALEYVSWPFEQAELEDAIERAHARAEGIGSVKLRETMARSRIEKLTRREREVLDGVAGGLSNRLIGERLSISPRTVEIHRANMLNKLGANHTSEAIRIAVEAELIS